jgi:hypothetical protein
VIVVRTQTVHVNVNIMTNEEKAIVYDDCIRESERLQRINSKIKSEHTTNIPQNLQEEIDRNNVTIDFLVKKLESLFN